MNPLIIGDLTIPVPIVQGGMGIGISMSRLAASAANMGGIGVIATVGLGLIHNSPGKGYRENNVDGVRSEIRKARANSSGILGVNVMTVLTNFADIVQTAIEEKIDVIFSGAGLPLDLPKYKTATSKTKLVPIVSSARAASIIAHKWKTNFDYLPDAFVVEGPKAGGHLGFSPKELSEGNAVLKDLVQETVSVAHELTLKYQQKIPIIAAGGIMSGEDIFDIMQAGASAVQLGSKFITTVECDASDEFKEAIMNSTESSIKIIQSPVGLPGRAVVNDFLIAAENGEKRPVGCKYNCIKSCDPKTTKYCIAEALLSAYKGDMNNGFAFSGAYAYELKSLSTVKDVFDSLVNEYNTASIKAAV